MTQELQTLYSELMDRMKQGTQMHDQLADYYSFLNLPGYQKCHEYQMLCELLTYRKAKDAYMREFNQLVQPNIMNMGMNTNNNSNKMGNNNNQNNSNFTYTHPNYADVIPQTWYQHTRYDVDANTKRNGVRDGFKRWIEYEKDTKQFLIEMAKRLEQADDKESARKLDYLIDHVEKEIEHAEEKMIALESANYDMNYILQQQEPLKEKYADKMRKLNMYDFESRRRGAGNYANYDRDEDDDDDDFAYGNGKRYYRRYYDNRY